VPDLIIERLDPSLPMPKYAKEGDAGFDLYAAESIPDMARIPYVMSTGIRVHIPKGYELQIRSRSSLASNGVFVVNSPGTIDEGYRGEIKVILGQTGDRGVFINKGDRIAQAVLAPVTRANIVEGVVSTDTERGEAGFGSTGR